MAFSFYVLSSVSRDLRHQFDKELVNAAANTGSYFEEFAEKQNIIGGTRETIRELKRGDEQLAVFQNNFLRNRTEVSSEPGRGSTFTVSLPLPADGRTSVC